MTSKIFLIVSIAFALLTLSVGWYAGAWWGVSTGIACVATLVVLIYVAHRIEQELYHLFSEIREEGLK